MIAKQDLLITALEADITRLRGQGKWISIIKRKERELELLKEGREYFSADLMQASNQRSDESKELRN
jgi:hypothetical protein